MKIAARFLPIAVLFFTLFTLTLTTPAHAAGPPNPQPCANTLYTAKLTKVVLEPLEFTFTRTGHQGDPMELEHVFNVTVDFSQLGAIFAQPTSNYLESRFQDENHRQANLLQLKSADFNQFHGPGQKAAPKVMLDQLRVKYVQYVYEKPELAESANQYADIEGKDPKTIYDLVTAFGQPAPPSLGGDASTWTTTWGRYWEKTPTTVSEFYYGIFMFPLVEGQKEIKQIEAGQCPPRLDQQRKVFFVLPEYFRTTSIANQLNQLIVPNAVQSSSGNFVNDNLFAQARDGAKEAFAKIIQACLKPFTSGPVANAFKKVVKISLDLLSPIKDAYALTAIPDDKFLENEAVPESCPKPIATLPSNKEGIGPFCSVPEIVGRATFNLNEGECVNVDSPHKLDNGTNVKCTFTRNYNRPLPIGTDKPGEEGVWDSCSQTGTDSAGQPVYTCQLTVRVYPIFYIPWLAPIWNNTTYSDQKDQIAVFNSQQETGRPGVYTSFTPKALDQTIFPADKNLPSALDNQAVKQRFFGATDCAKQFVRDIILKPKILQQILGISPTCPITQASQPPTNPNPPPPQQPPPPQPPPGPKTCPYSITWLADPAATNYTVHYNDSNNDPQDDGYSDSGLLPTNQNTFNFTAVSGSWWRVYAWHGGALQDLTLVAYSQATCP